MYIKTDVFLCKIVLFIYSTLSSLYRSNELSKRLIFISKSPEERLVLGFNIFHIRTYSTKQSGSCYTHSAPGILIFGPLFSCLLAAIFLVLAKRKGLRL